MDTFGTPAVKSLTIGRIDAPIATGSVWTTVPSIENTTLPASQSIR